MGFGESSLATRKGFPDVGYARRFDQASETIAYFGEADLGSSPASAAWRIQRLTLDSAGDVTVEWADGASDFNHIWDNRAGLSYS
jgi:hypothetical protein